MTIPVQIPSFREAPAEYDRQYFDEMFKAMRLYMQRINADGDITCRGINSNLPQSTDGTGLRQGAFYRDANNFVKVVP